MTAALAKPIGIPTLLKKNPALAAVVTKTHSKITPPTIPRTIFVVFDILSSA
jgi:hypothetical protein